MDTSQSFVKKIRAKYGAKARTDYGLAKLMGMKPQSICNWNQRNSIFEDGTGYIIAELLDLDPAYVLACLAAERADRSKNENVKKTWERVAHVFQYAARTAAAVLLGVVVLRLVSFDFAALYIMSNYAFIVSLGLISIIAVTSYRVNLKHFLNHFLMQEA